MKVELVAKTLIFNAAGELLVLRRHANDEYRPGGWDIPGGQVEYGEDPKDAAIREAVEETGLTISHLIPIHVATNTQADCQVVKTVFMTRTYTGKCRLSHEHSEFKWISTEEFDLLDISNDYKAAAHLLRKD